MQRGERWAMGDEAEVVNFFFPGMNVDLDDFVDSYTHKEHEIEGEAGYYQIIHTVAVEEDTYHLRVQGGGGVHSTIEYHAEGDAIAEGVHDMESDYPLERRIMAGEGHIHYTNELTMDMFFYKSNMTLHSIEITSKWNYRGRFQATNASFFEEDGTDLSIYYEDVDVYLNGNRMLSLFFEFDEALDLLSKDEESETNFTKTTSAVMEGVYGGVFNIRGLPESQEQKMLDEHDAIEFPIYWEDSDLDLEGSHDGIIEETEVSVHTEFDIGTWEPMELADERRVDVRPSDYLMYIVDVEDLPALYGTWWYSPDLNFFVAHEMGGTYASKIFVQATGSETIEMMPVCDELAAQRMKELQHIPPLSSTEALFRPPYVYLIMGTLLAAVLMIYYRKRWKKKQDK